MDEPWRDVLMIITEESLFIHVHAQGCPAWRPRCHTVLYCLLLCPAVTTTVRFVNSTHTRIKCRATQQT